MTTTQTDQLTVFHLEDREFDDAGIKNDCFTQAKTAYVAYVLNSSVADQELLAALEENTKTQEDKNPIVYITGNTMDGQLDYIETLRMLPDAVIALLFSREQLQRAGAFHSKLSAMTNYEFLCRMVKETGQCAVRAVKGMADIPAEMNDSTSKEDVAETLAYMIRQHMNSLHALGMMDSIFTLFCEYAQREDFFPVFQQKVNLFLSDERAYEKLARQTAPFVILRGDDTCGGVLQGFADDLAEGLVRNGQAVIMMDDDFTQHEKLQNMICKGVVGFQNKALEIDFFRKIRGPKFQFWFDNPLRFEKVLRNLPEEYFILCQDANYASLIREYYHTPNALQFPPGGRVPREASSKCGSVQEACPYDIVFMGNYFQDDGNVLEGFEREFYEYMLRHPCETFERGLSELLQEKTADGKISSFLNPGIGNSSLTESVKNQQHTEGSELHEQGREELRVNGQKFGRNSHELSMDSHELNRNSHELSMNGSGSSMTDRKMKKTYKELDEESFVKLSCSLKPVCRAVIGHYRNAVVSTILDAGFDLHVYGDGWRNYKGPGREHLQIHPYATVDESLRELGKAKIGLNIMSWHKAGMTERIANIMLSGAVCLTEDTAYLREHMRDGEEIVSFSLERLTELPAKIKELLDHPDVREKIAENAYHRAMAEYTWERRAEELIALSDCAAQDALTVFVATHVKCNPPQDPVYVPLHVGRKGKADLGYLGDDTGENISDLNFLYGELTGLFWIWQNVHDMDYVGLCHYRRYFINSQKQAMEKREYLELLERYDAIVPKHAECEDSYYRHFSMSHNSRDLDAVERALKRIYPSYAEAYDQAMRGRIYYWGNLVVTSLPILKAYAEWLFQIFAEASEEIDISGYDDYHKRVYGFLSEQMFYVFALANNLSLCETAVGVSEEKAETRELKERLKKLMSENRTEEARSLFAAQLRVRPDLLLQGSDLNGELMAVYRQLFDRVQ